MNSQLSERIRLHSANFSKGQRMIARYIEEHSEQVAFMTASRLGQTVGVSESTVVRFATEIGYSGYPALQQLSLIHISLPARPLLGRLLQHLHRGHPGAVPPV